jgi:uncharacterized protein
MKRILALDGGGIRGVFSLQILARIEELFRQDQNEPNLVLADVFDLIAGTSTGAIIATFLAWGKTVREIERLYVERGAEMFARERWYRRWKDKYRADAIAQFLREIFSEQDGTCALLGSKRLRTLLLVIVRNASTGSAWPLWNNPDAKYSDRARANCNLDVPLWQLLRASTAAPYYFPPEDITLGDKHFLFVDGGLTPFNNPSLIAILMATLPAYRLSWPATREALHVISVGTGAVRARLPQKMAAKINMVDQIKYLAPALLGSVAIEQDILCRILGDCLHGAKIDTEIESLNAPSLFTQSEQKFTYARYDDPFDVTPSQAKELVTGRAEMDNLKLIPDLQKAGEEYAKQHVQPEHLVPRR